jgi:molybdopterin-synthase adenylyltransferase
MDTPISPQNRYHRQSLLRQIGPAGQRRLGQSRILLVGCGALGSVLADQLVRGGVGFLRIADRDIVELTNLQRQVLYDEQDAAEGMPKAVAAARRLRAINSAITIDERVVDVHAGNIEQLAEGMHLLLDGTDNVETRYLINDLSIRRAIPWIYGACIGTEGRAMAILPGRTPCLRCIFPEPPSPGELPTCDTAGVLAAAAGMVAGMQSALALAALVGPAGSASAAEGPSSTLLSFDLWPPRFLTVDTSDARRPDCRCCGLRRFDFLDAPAVDRATSLCGRQAVQIAAPAGGVDLAAICARLQAAGQVQRTAHLARCRLAEPAGLSLTIFPDGRIIVQGTGDVARARSVVARFVGM